MKLTKGEQKIKIKSRSSQEEAPLHEKRKIKWISSKDKKKSSFNLNKVHLFIGIGGFVVVCLTMYFIYFYSSSSIDKPESSTNYLEASSTNDHISTASAETWFGKPLASFDILAQGIFAEDQTPLLIYKTLSNQFPFLSQFSIDQSNIPAYQLAENQRYILLSDSNDPSQRYFIFESTPEEYWEIGLSDPLSVQKIRRKVEKKQTSYATIIKSDLKSALDKLPMDSELSEKIEQSLAWTVDLYHLEPATKLKLLYDVTYIDEEVQQIDTLQAIWLQTDQKEYYVYYFRKDSIDGYFNHEAYPMKTTFLKAPVPYNYISSSFGSRLHPIAQEQKFHFGTDYVAQSGTPIHAVADGEVIDAKFRAHNGYFVRLRHFGGYETFYLHMQKNSFPPEIVKGARVHQGEIIGSVGQTGDATGPHVCFHFRHHGKPIDPEQVELSRSSPLPVWALPAFFKRRDILKQKLDDIQYFE